MVKGNEVPPKEKYRLWWEYLKRGEHFERISAQLKKIAPKITSSEKSRYPTGFLGWDLPKPPWSRDPGILSEIRSKKRGYLLFRELFWLYSSFDEWWDKGFLHKKIKVENITSKVAQFREYFGDLAADRVDSIYVEKYFGNDRTISRDKFDIGFILFQPLNSDLIISIDRIDLWNKADLEKKIRAIIGKRKKEIMEKNFAPGLSKIMRYKEIRHYLDVFNRVKSLKEKKQTWEKITSFFCPDTARGLKDENLSQEEHDSILNKFENHQRLLEMEYSKAKKIISNAEKGQFPGKY